MQDMGFRSLLVLAKIGYDLRNEFSDTLDDDVESAFGPLLEALDGTRGMLRLSDTEYDWLSDAAFFEAYDAAALEEHSGHLQKRPHVQQLSLAS